MKQQSSTKAIQTVIKDTQFLEKTRKFRKATIELNSDYIDVEYRTTDTVRQIPDNHADKWRIFASDNELVLVFTYYYDPELE